VMSDSSIDRLKLEVPVVEHIDKKLLDAVGDGSKLEMCAWHQDCGTTHCRGGWYVTFGGAAGKKLEQALGPERAARMIYEASTGRSAPDFHASNETALADIRARAQATAETSGGAE
jgi:hypothetical protein